MEPDTLRGYTFADFPIRLKVTNGESFEIASPEMMMVGDYEVGVMVRRNDAMRIVTISLINIVTAESLAEPAT